MYWCCPLNEDFRLETFVIYVFFNQVITFLRWLTTVTAKEVTSRKKPHGKRKRLTAVSLGRQVFSFAVSLFLSAVRFLLLSRVFLFCREVISFAVTVVGHRTFCCRSHTKLKFREAFCFFSPGSNVVVLSSQYPHIIAPKSRENMHCHICWIRSHTLLTGASFLWKRQHLSHSWSLQENNSSRNTPDNHRGNNYKSVQHLRRRSPLILPFNYLMQSWFHDFVCAFFFLTKFFFEFDGMVAFASNTVAVLPAVVDVLFGVHLFIDDAIFSQVHRHYRNTWILFKYIPNPGQSQAIVRVVKSFKRWVVNCIERMPAVCWPQTLFDWKPSSLDLYSDKGRQSPEKNRF